jgi:transcriptional regulator with XRE-family HTH domain
MRHPSTTPAELSNLGKWLFTARTQQSFTQKELATRSKLTQARVSQIEQGLILPTLPQLIRLARALSLPLQWFLNGSTAPGNEVPDIALELQRLGVVDLLVPGAVVPGAFRPTEQVIALAVSGNQPEPRIIEAIPAVLAWNPWSASVLRVYSHHCDARAGNRLAWLADVALTIHRNGGFPGGCPQCRKLESYVRWWSKHPTRPPQEDDLGRPAARDNLPPVWKRWKIRYDAPLSAFAERAQLLHSLREQKRSSPELPPRPNDD